MAPYAQIELGRHGFRILRSLTDFVHLVEKDDSKSVAKPVPHDFSLTESFVKVTSKAWQQLEHPGVVGLRELILDHPQFVIREYFPGSDLRTLIYSDQKVRSPLPLNLVVYLGAMICDALAALHRDVGVHGAISPGHILVSADGAVSLIGLEDLHQHVLMPTSRAGIYVPSYYPWLNPQAGEDDPRGDLFSLGVCLWEWTSGERLFERSNSYQTVWAVYKDPIPSLERGVPHELAATIDWALRRDPDERFQSAAEMGDALRRSSSCAPDLARHALAAWVEASKR